MSQNNLRLYSILESVGYAVIATDSQGRVIYINPVAEKLVGWKRDEALGMKCMRVFRIAHDSKDEKKSGSAKKKSKKKPLCQKLMSKVLRKGETVSLDNPGVFKNRNGQEVFMEGSISPVMNGKSTAQGAVVVFRGANEKRKETEELTQRAAELELIINNIPAMVWFKDNQSRFVKVNKLYAGVVGKNPEEFEGKTDFEFYPDKQAEKFIKMDSKVMESKSIQEIYEEKKKDGTREKRFLHTVKIPVKKGDGDVAGTIGICQDITEVKQAQERAELLNDVLASIREINRLIFREKNPLRLIEQTCKNLVTPRGSKAAWIVLVNEVGVPEYMAGENIPNLKDKFRYYIEDGNIPYCWKRAGKKSGVVAIKKRGTTCQRCPLYDIAEGSSVLSIRLKYEQRLFGYLSIYLGKQLMEVSEVEAMLAEVSEDISFALYTIDLEKKSETLEDIVHRVVFIDAEYFNDCVSSLGGRTFRGTYMVADAVDSSGHNLDQEKFQSLLKGIVVKYGAVWGHSWGDMIHCVFSDYFFPTSDGHEISAYTAAIEICKEVKEKMGVAMRVGLATGRLSVNESTIQMNQTRRSRIIEKSSMAQEGRLGITTLQEPSDSLKYALYELGYAFEKKEDIVRGSITPIWKLYPKRDDQEVIVSKQKKGTLSYAASMKVLLMKGVCGHGHFEGTAITPKIAKIVRKAGDVHKRRPDQAERFKKLTGKSVDEVLKMLDRVESWGESRKKFDFVRHFLPWLHIMKLGEASSPQVLYELTRAQMEHDLRTHAGFTRGVCPTVWKEMGLSHSKNIDAFVSAIEDSLAGLRPLGPIQIGVSLKRQFLERRVSKDINPFISDMEYPYLKALDLISALKQSRVASKIGLFVDVVDVARTNPLFSHRDHPRRSQHTERYYKEAASMGADAHVHLLEEIVDSRIIKNKKGRYKELPFILELFDKLRIKKARFIHMAYWPKELPYIEEIVKAGHEIAVCQTSTRALGSMHRPQSPFLLKNPAVAEGLAYSDKFPCILASTDDSGPLDVRNVWEEIIVIHNDLAKWHGEDIADLALIRLLRNSYRCLSCEEVSHKYGLDVKAVEWVFACDIYQKQKELHDKEKRGQVRHRVKELLEKRQLLTEKKT